MDAGLISEIFVNPKGFTVDGVKYPANWRDLASLGIFLVTQEDQPIYDAKTQRLILNRVAIGGVSSVETWTTINLTQGELDAIKYGEIDGLHDSLNTARIIEDLVGFVVAGEPISAAVKAKINQIRSKRGQSPL